MRGRAEAVARRHARRSASRTRPWGESTIPSSLQLTSDEAVLGIGSIILPEGPISSVPRCLEIAGHRLPRLVTLYRDLCLGRSRGLHRGRLQDGKQRHLDDVIHTQPAECDAIGLPIIESSTNARITTDLTFGPRVLHGELPTTTTASQQP